MLKLENLHVRPSANAPLVLQGLSLAIHADQVTVLVGASGCGKTTLLRAIAGLVPIEKGKIFSSDQDITSASPFQRNLSLIAQSGSYYDHWTVKQHLRHDAIEGKGVKADPIVELQLLNETGLLSFADAYPHQLSGGQKQRLAIARAIAANRRIVLMDEPLVHLDELSKQELMPLLHSMRNKNRVVIYVTHDYNDAMLLADQIGVFSSGQIVQIDDPHQVYREPQTIDAARILGQYPAQFVEAQVLSPQTIRIPSLETDLPLQLCKALPTGSD